MAMLCPACLSIVPGAVPWPERSVVCPGCNQLIGSWCLLHDASIRELDHPPAWVHSEIGPGFVEVRVRAGGPIAGPLLVAAWIGFMCVLSIIMGFAGANQGGWMPCGFCLFCPFLVLGFVFLWITSVRAFGILRLRRSPRGIDTFWGIGPLGRQRHVNPAEVRSVRATIKPYTRRGHTGVYRSVRIDAPEPITLVDNLSGERTAYIQALLWEWMREPGAPRPNTSNIAMLAPALAPSPPAQPIPIIANCDQCGSPIPLYNIDTRLDLATCPRCGQVSTYTLHRRRS